MSASGEYDFGSDSFLDVITNFVGILIILVMVVGERAKHFTESMLAKANSQLEAAAGRRGQHRRRRSPHRLANGHRAKRAAGPICRTNAAT